MGSMKTIQIFKPGKHITAGGDALNFSESDVLAMVAAYDPATHEAPIVVGHPKHDGPAYGWIKSLSFAEGILNAEPHQIDVDFAEMVDKKRFKKISASFYHPESPSNPKPGAYYLRHVGFLGAQPPAVKGLRNPEFKEGDENIINIEFSEESYAWGNLADMFRRLREYVIGKDGTDKADQLIPNWQIDQLQRTAQESQQEEDENGRITSSPAFSEPPTGASMTPEQIAALQAENERLKASADQVAARESELAAQAAKHASAANIAFCESLVASAQLHPSQKNNAIALLNGLSSPAAAQSPAVVEFSEGSATTAMPLADAFKALLKAQPKIVEFGESGKQRGAATDFDDPNALAAKAIEFQESERAAGREINTAQAVEHISRQV